MDGSDNMFGPNLSIMDNINIYIIHGLQLQHDHGHADVHQSSRHSKAQTIEPYNIRGVSTEDPLGQVQPPVLKKLQIFQQENLL